MNDLIKKIKKAVYPLFLAIYIAVVIWLFIGAAGFLSTSLNKIFSANGSPSQTEPPKIDMSRYALVAKKLGLSLEIQETPAPVQEQIPEPQPEPTSTPIIDKSTLKISILNTSGVKGLAADLKIVFEAAGFKIENTGNQSPALSQTIIKTKQKISDSQTLTDEIKNLVSAKYSFGEIQILQDSETYDIIILIGKK